MSYVLLSFVFTIFLFHEVKIQLSVISNDYQSLLNTTIANLKCSQREVIISVQAITQILKFIVSPGKSIGKGDSFTIAATSHLFTMHFHIQF